MADIEYLKSLLGVHPNWPQKVATSIIFTLTTNIRM